MTSEMRQFRKISVLVISVFLLRLAVGCCNCEDQYYSFDYENILIENIDNSGQWSKPSESNAMPAEGVAFEIQILGSDPVLSAKSQIFSTGFTTASAQSCNCEELYVASHTITEIKIRTLEDLNSDYCCNDDVTSLFLANSCLSCEDIGNFYITIDKLIHRINPEAFYQIPVNKFLIYLKTPVENTTAKFEIEVVLSNGKSIIGQTKSIDIL